MALVLTIDQRSSRTTADLVAGLVRSLNRRHSGAALRRRFERTAGDELQGVVADASVVVDIVAELLRADTWSIGLGVGEVDEPLPRSTRAGMGRAFVHAREAVERAKTGPHPIGVVGDDPYRAEQVETVLWLLAWVLARRSRSGWEAVDLLSEGLTRAQIADRLGISASAVSQRLQVAACTEEERARILATQLLDPEDAR